MLLHIFFKIRFDRIFICSALCKTYTTEQITNKNQYYLHNPLFHPVNRACLPVGRVLFQFIINTFTLLCRILNAISAIRFSLSSVGFTSVISKQQTLRLCMNLLIRSSTSLSLNPFPTGVPVPREIEESSASTSKLI